tara:strand:- start:1342 stop:2706 length:1365 start_codon:yes stop_codon:yes gene_type:complete
VATTTLEASRQEFLSRYGLGTPEAVEFSTTTNITTDNSVISTGLVGAGYGDDDYFGGGGPGSSEWYILITGSNNSQVGRRVIDYTGTSGTVVVAGPALSAESGSVTFEMMKVHPTRVLNLLNEARLEAFPSLHITKIDETVWTTSGRVTYEQPASIIGRPYSVWIGADQTPESYGENLLGDLAVGDWTGTNITLAAEAVTTNPTNYATWQDGSIKCTTDVASTAGTSLTSVSNPSNHDALRFSFGIRVYSLTADRITPSIKLNSTTTEGTAHGGTGWEYLTVQATLNTLTLSSIDVGLTVSVGTDFIFYQEEEGILTAGPMYFSDLDFIQLLNWEWEPRASGSSNADLIRFRDHLPDRRQLRIVGLGQLSALGTEASTVEVGKPEINILYDTAAVKLFQELSNHPGTDQRMTSALSRAEDRLRESKSEHRMPFPRTRVSIPDAGGVHVLRSSRR